MNSAAAEDGGARTRSARENRRNQLEHADDKGILVRNLVDDHRTCGLTGVAVLDRDKRDTEYNQRHADRLEVVEQRIELVIEQQTDHGRRNAGNDDFEPQPKDHRVGNRAAVLGLLERHEPPPVNGQHGENRTELNDHKEYFLECFGRIELQKLVYQNHMTGTRYRQPLGDTLDNAEENGL